MNENGDAKFRDKVDAAHRRLDKMEKAEEFLAGRQEGLDIPGRMKWAEEEIRKLQRFRAGLAGLGAALMAAIGYIMSIIMKGNQ